MKKSNYLKVVIIFCGFLCLISIFIILLRNFYLKSQEKDISQQTKNLLKEIEELQSMENLKLEDKKEENIFVDGCIGVLKIPCINIEAKIYEGTGLEVLKYWIGHFTETPIWRTEMLLWHHIMKAHMLTIFQE